MLSTISTELFLPIGREHDVVEAEDRLDAICELGDAFGHHFLAGGSKARQFGIAGVVVLRPAARENHRVLEAIHVQRKAPRDRLRGVFGQMRIRAIRRGPDCRHESIDRKCVVSDQLERHGSEQADDARFVGVDERSRAARVA